MAIMTPESMQHDVASTGCKYALRKYRINLLECELEPTVLMNGFQAWSIRNLENIDGN